MAVLVILPHTFIIRLSLLPFVLWPTWGYAGVISADLAPSLGIEIGERLNHCNLTYVVRHSVAINQVGTAKPLRRYEPFTEGQHTPVEWPLTISNIILDTVDLLFNQRGIRWSWAPKSTIAGDTFFDPDRNPLPRAALAAFFTLCCGFTAYTAIEVMYHIATLVGRVLLRQSAADWPALSARPWMATSIADYWSFRWHQCLRQIFTVFGARPGGALLGRPGALLGAFGVSAVLHHIGVWGLGRGAEFSTTGAFFVLMGIGAALEHLWQRTTGIRVRGFWGWAWTMTWTLLWGTFMLDGWARRGLFACDFFTPRVRLGKPIIDGVIVLITNN